MLAKRPKWVRIPSLGNSAHISSAIVIQEDADGAELAREHLAGAIQSCSC
jgi:hypothetical protein